MSSEPAGLAVSALAARWWTLVVRGIAAIVFGILTFMAPGSTLVALVLVWGVYALVDGLFTLLLAARGAREGRSWGWLLFEGIVGIAAGLATFAMPGMTAVVLLSLIAFWAVLTGIGRIAAAIQLRSLIPHEWLLAASGALAIVFGVILFASPGAGALALAWVIGAYALVLGAVWIGLGLRLNRVRRELRGPPSLLA